MRTRNSKPGPGNWVLMLAVGGILGIFLAAIFKQSITGVTPGVVAFSCVLMGAVFFSANWAGAGGRVVQFAMSCIAAMLVTALILQH